MNNENETQKILLEKYLGQDDLPQTERWSFESETGDRVALYAYTDLDENFRSNGTWILLGATHLRVGTTTLETSSIKKIEERAGLSSSELRLFGENDRLLAMVLYTHRQRPAVAHVRFALEQIAKGESMPKVSKSAQEMYGDSMLKGVKDAQASVSVNKHSVLWRLLGYLTPYKKKVFLGVSSSVMLTVFSLMPSWLTGATVDRLIKPVEDGHLTFAQAQHLAWVFIAGLAASFALREFFTWYRLKSMAVLGEYVATSLRRDLYAHMQKLGVDFFSRKQTGSLVSRITSDTDRLWDFVAFGVIEVFVALLMLVGVGGMLLYLDWRLGLVMIAPVPFLLYSIYWHGERMKMMFVRIWRKWSKMTGSVSDTLAGVRVVKAFNKEEQEIARFTKANKDVEDEAERLHNAWTLFWPLFLMGIHAVTIAVWAFGMPRVLGTAAHLPVSTLTPGVFVSFILYTTLFMQPIEVIGQTARMMNRAVSSAHRVFEILDTEPRVFDEKNALSVPKLQGRIVFDGVGFTYDGLRQILKNVSFAIEPGEMIGIVGPSGSGKTTLINLMARFFDVTAGRIEIDGVDLKKLRIGEYRTQVGMVMQDPYLFHGTLLDNIRYGRPDATLGEVVAAARAANAHEFIAKLPHAYDTMVGERGHTLSGGERQRVSIARAILQNPRVLILDEATSAVDTETERKIQTAIDNLVAGRTVIAIAHRLSTLKKANRLLVMKDGKLVEAGTHEHLLGLENGVYRKLFELQNEMQKGRLTYAV